MTAVDNSLVDNSMPPIEKCLRYWHKGYGGMHNRAAELKLELEGICQISKKPPLQCMFDQLESCKGQRLRKLTSNSSTFITDTERKLLWCAAFGQKLVRKENESRIVKAGFLQWLLTNPEAVKFISTDGIYAEEIIIEGDLHLENVTINFPIVLEKSYFLGSINLTGIKTSFLSLKGSTCSQGINICGANISGDFNCSEGNFINKGKRAFWAKHIQVSGDLFLIDSYVNGEANLSGAKIEGNIDCSRGVFINPAPAKSSSQNEIYALDIRLAKVDGKVCFNSFRVAGHVYALEMKIDGDLDCTGGSIVNETGNYHAISIDRSSIGGDVLLCQGFSATGQVRLIGTTIAGDLDCSGGEFNHSSGKDYNALYAPRAKVEGCVYLCESMEELENNRRDFVTNGFINLELTNIKDSIYIGKYYGNKTSIFNDGGIVLNGAKITNSLVWKSVLLTKTTRLLLFDTTVGRLVTSGGEKSWPNLYLDGFFYNRIEHQDLENNYKTHLKWLKRQSIFNLQIYEQLATVLHRNGQDADAIEISIAKEKIRRKPKGSYWWLNPSKLAPWLWSLILNITIGYGYKTYRVLLFSIILILLGGFIFDIGYTHKIVVPTDGTDRTDYFNGKRLPSDYPEFNPFTYSLGTFLPTPNSLGTFIPILKLQQQDKWQPDHSKLGRLLRVYQGILTIMGLLLTPFIVWTLTTYLNQTIARNK